MNRRHLFNLLAGAAFAPKCIILPPRGGWPVSGSWGDYVIAERRERLAALGRAASTTIDSWGVVAAKAEGAPILYDRELIALYERVEPYDPGGEELTVIRQVMDSLAFQSRPRMRRV